MHPVGIIDLGSNTVRLSIYTVDQTNHFENLLNKKETVGLAGYIENGRMSEAGISRAIATLSRFKTILEGFNISDVHVLATAPLRNIDNTSECIDRIQFHTGLNIDLLSGEEEATLDFDGAMLCTDLSDGLLIDIGGGSTELVCFKDRSILQAVSLPIGSLSGYTRYFKTLTPSKKQIKALKENVKELLSVTDFIKTQNTSNAVGVGGSIRAANKCFKRLHSLNENMVLTTQQINELYKLIKTMDDDGLNLVLKAAPDRIHTIISGMTILTTILNHFDVLNLTISSYGVREGYLNQWLNHPELHHGA